MPMHELWRREVTVRTAYGAAPGDLAMALDLIAARRVRVDDLVTHRAAARRHRRGVRARRRGARVREGRSSSRSGRRSQRTRRPLVRPSCRSRPSALRVEEPRFDACLARRGRVDHDDALRSPPAERRRLPLPRHVDLVDLVPGLDLDASPSSRAARGRSARRPSPSGSFPVRTSGEISPESNSTEPSSESTSLTVRIQTFDRSFVSMTGSASPIWIGNAEHLDLDRDRQARRA